jgi:hypothetical protein
MTRFIARSVLDLTDEFGKLSLWVKADQELMVYAFTDHGYRYFEVER